jgi:hypothetical protein
MDLRATKWEWIYTQTRVSDQVSLELALLMKKKKERTRNG